MFASIFARIWDALKNTFHGWNEHDGFLLSAAMAYYASFSLFPLCLVLIAAFSWISRSSTALSSKRLELIDIVESNAGPWVGEQLSNLLRGVDTNAIIGGPVGLATLVIGAIAIFMQFEATFDRIWGTSAPPITGVFSFLHRLLFDRIVAFAMLLAVGALLILVSLANFVAEGFKPYIDRLPAGAYAWAIVQPGLTFVTNALIFGAIYKFIPKVFVRWSEALSGGVLVSFVWQLGQIVLAKIVISTHYTAYGVVGSFVAIMVWTYYASAVIFLGAEFVRATCRYCPVKKH
jgi:membrane protein